MYYLKFIDKEKEPKELNDMPKEAELVSHGTGILKC